MSVAGHATLPAVACVVACSRRPAATDGRRRCSGRCRGCMGRRVGRYWRFCSGRFLRRPRAVFYRRCSCLPGRLAGGWRALIGPPARQPARRENAPAAKMEPGGWSVVSMQKASPGDAPRGERFMRSAEFPPRWVASFAPRRQPAVIDWGVFGADGVAGERRYRHKCAIVCLRAGEGIEFAGMAVRDSPTKAAVKATPPLFLTLLIKENLNPHELVDLWGRERTEASFAEPLWWENLIRDPLPAPVWVSGSVLAATLRNYCGYTYDAGGRTDSKNAPVSSVK